MDYLTENNMNMVGLIYNLKVFPKSKRIDVKCRMNNLDGEPDEIIITMEKQYAHLSDFAKFVRNFRAISDTNNPLPLTRHDENSWKIKTNNVKSVIISYSIDIGSLERERLNLESKKGSQHFVSYLHKERGFILSHDVFAYPISLRGQEQILVRVKPPTNWQAFTGWKKENGVYVVNGVPKGFLVFGQFDTTVTQMDDLLFTMISFKNSFPFDIRFPEFFEQTFSQYKKIFGNFPENRFTAILDKTSGDYCAGTVLGNTGIFVMGERIINYRPWFIPFFIAHELFHVWEMLVIVNDANCAFWLTEGLAEYYSLVTVKRTGNITEEKFYDFLNERRELLIKNPLFGKMSFNEASSWIFKDRKAYELVYFGGTFLWMWLDQEIRRASNGKKSLDNVVKAVYLLSQERGRLLVEDVYKCINEASSEKIEKQFRELIESEQGGLLPNEMKKLGIPS